MLRAGEERGPSKIVFANGDGDDGDDNGDDGDNEYSDDEYGDEATWSAR